MTMKTISLPLMMASLLAGCSNEGQEAISSAPSHAKETTSVFPDMPSIDNTVYENIKKTCAQCWQLEKMKMDTFKVVPQGDEYVVECDGIVDGELYRSVIRANASGQWINDGRAKKNP